MIAFLLSPLGRWAAVGAVCASLAAWGGLERLGRQMAQAEVRAARAALDGCQANLRNMEIRRHADDDAARERDPVGRLLREWSRD